MKKLTSQVREDAIEICLIAANNPELADSYFEVLEAIEGPVADSFRDITSMREAYPEMDLALEAWDLVEFANNEPNQYADLDAAALLEEGFVPDGWEVA